MIILFLIPYGLIAAELGTTFESDGGLYDWVRKAHEEKWEQEYLGITGSISHFGWLH